jgi:AP-1 complex subunit beta-1
LQVQLQILTAVVKLFLKTAQNPAKRDEAQQLLQTVLKNATSENDNPDIRDRAYIYWRLLSINPDNAIARDVILADKPPITSTIQNLPQGLLEQLLAELSTLASVYHRPPAAFIEARRGKGLGILMKRAIEEQRENAAENAILATAGAQKNNVENLLDIDFDGGAPATPSTGVGLADLMSPTVQSPVVGPGQSNLDDLLSLGMGGGEGGGGGAAGMGLENGFAGLDLGGSSGTATPQAGTAGKKTNQDILGLF